MHTTFLAIHNLLRWLVLLSALLAVIHAWRGLVRRSDWGMLDALVGKVLSISLSVQFIVGLVLYLFLCPMTRAAFADFGAAMKNATLRFYAIEHLVLMVAALALAHIGTASTKRAAETPKKYRRAVVWFTLTLIVLLLGIPWDRPLLP